MVRCGCPTCGLPDQKRQVMKRLAHVGGRRAPRALKTQMLAAMRNVQPGHLLDSVLGSASDRLVSSGNPLKPCRKFDILKSYVRPQGRKSEDVKFLRDRRKTRYSIADEKVRLHPDICCKTCDAVITVREGMDADGQPRTALHAGAGRTPMFRPSWASRTCSKDAGLDVPRLRTTSRSRTSCSCPSTASRRARSPSPRRRSASVTAVRARTRTPGWSASTRG